MRFSTAGWTALTTMIAASSTAWATVASPVFTPGEGDSAVVLPVIISCLTSGSTIHYTLNGSEPTLSDPVITSGGTVTIARNLTLKAKAWASSETSATTTASYKITGDIAAGASHALSLASSGAIKAWGEQGSGRLGNGLSASADVTSPTASKYPSAVAITDAIAIAAGQNHSVFIKKGSGGFNSVWAFGNNGSGEVGDNTLTNRDYAVQVMKSAFPDDWLTNCSMVSAGENFSGALSQDGKVWTWGGQGSGRLGNGSASGNRKYAGLVQTSASGNPILTDIVSISLGSTFALAQEKIDAATSKPGYVWSWGQGAAGRTGQNTTGNLSFAGKVLMPDLTPLTDAWDVSAGGSHGVVVRRNNSGVNGSVWTFGDATSGRLGNNDSSNNKLTAVQVKKTTSSGLVNLEGIRMVAAGSAHTLALDDDGKVWAWGYNGNGALGNGNTAYSTSAAFAIPVMPPGSTPSTTQQLGDATTGKIVWIAAGGEGNNNTSYAISERGLIYAWGRNDDGEMGNGSNTGSVSYPTNYSNFRAFPAPPDTTLAYSLTSAMAPGSVTLTATPSDSDGPGDIKRVDFYSQGVLVGTKTASPWVLTLGSLTAGNYHVYAVVTDQGDSQGYSSPVSFTIGSSNPNADDDGDGLTTSQETTIGTDPNNPDSDVNGGDGMWDGYEQYYGLAPLSKLDSQAGNLGPNDDKDGDGMANKDESDRGRIPTSPTESPAITGTFPNSFAKWFGVAGVTYHFEYSSNQTNWTRYSTPLTGANAELSLQISTVVGGTLPSPFYTRLVTESHAPEVSLAATVSTPATPVGPGSGTLTATPTDPDGPADVASVEFFLDGASQGTVAAPGPWTWPLTSLAAGAHTARAIVKDLQGKRGFSSTSSFTVQLVDPDDADSDGMPDDWEVTYGLDPAVNDAGLDLDSDGLTNLEEYQGSTNPAYYDTDGDQFGDAFETVTSGFNPRVYNNPGADSDSDGLTDLEELAAGTRPDLGDSDSDGISDPVELAAGSDPRDGGKQPFNPTSLHGVAVDPVMAPMGDLGTSFTGTGQYKLSLEIKDLYSPLTTYLGQPARGSEQESWRVWIGLNRYFDTAPASSPTPFVGGGEFTLDGSKAYELRVQNLGVATTTFPDLDPDPSADYKHSFSVFSVTGNFLLLSNVYTLLNPFGFSRDTTFSDYRDSWRDHRLYAIPLAQTSYSNSYAGSDATGPRFRKISHFGRPMSDSPPEAEAESDEAAEESYVDAFDLSLHHDTSFASIPLAASDLRLEANASVRETTWSDRGGLRPSEEITSPFGICWSSNLCAYIEAVETRGSSTTRPTSVTVVDESGRPQRFGTSDDMATFFPWPSSLTDKKTYLNELTKSGDNLILTKKYGNKLTYQPCDAWFTYSSDRLQPSPTAVRHRYWRLVEVEDRFGAKVQYNYGSSTFSLIPVEIQAVGRTDQKLTIGRSANGRRIDWIKDAENNTTNFEYDSTKSISVDGIAYPYTELKWVQFPGGAKETYAYNVLQDPELDAIGSKVTRHMHANLGSIQRDGYAKRVFTYDFDRTKNWYDASGGRMGITASLASIPSGIAAQARAYVANKNKVPNGSANYRVQYGVPRHVRGVSWPDLSPVIASTFAKTTGTQTTFGPSFSATNGTDVTDAAGKKYTYTFSGTHGQIIDTDASSTAGSTSVSTEWLIYYTGMTLEYKNPAGAVLGQESFEFDPDSGLSLKKITDFSGNATDWTFDYDRPTGPRLALEDSPDFLAKWADPSTKTDARGRLETYAYGNRRMMTESIDVHGTKTTYTVDTMGRRTSTVVTNPAGQKLSEEVYEYGYSNPANSPYFPGFVSKKTRKKFGSSDPSWVADLVVDYVPDSYGRVASEIVDPGSGHKNLTTVYTYNKNNQRLTSRDPRLNTTSFEYDAIGRLVKTTFADTKFKQLSYDANNAKVKETDENGVATFFERDGLGRIVKVARDLNKSGTLNTGDIITTTEYNKVGLVTKVVNPRGYAAVTTYDDLHRPEHVYGGVPEGQTGGNLASLAATSREITHDEMFYSIGSNTGGGLSAPFKPTRIDHHNVVSMDRDSSDVTLSDVFVYDEVYRQTSASKEYQSGVSKTQTTAFNIGDTDATDKKETLVSKTTQESNSDLTIPDLVTRTTVDGLGRVVEVIDGYGLAGGLENATTTQYTSTGLAWKGIDPLNRVTETEYDLVGRPVKVWQPDPSTGLITANSPMAQSVYDANGNVTAVIDPLLNTTEFDFDVRNRKLQTRAPSVTNASVPTAPVTSVPTTSTIYDDAGNAIAVTDARNSTIRTFYDAANRPVKVRSNPVTGTPSSNVDVPGTNDITTTTVLDAGGLATSVTDGNGNITRNAYDGLGRLVATITDPSTGNPVDPGTSGFNAATYRSSNPTGILVTTKYDDAGNIIEVVDGAGQVTAFTYDGLARKTSTIRDANSSIKKIEVSVFNEFYQTSRVDAAGRKTVFRYDDRQRLSKVVYAPVGTAITSSHADNREITYDKVGKVTKVKYTNDPGSIRETISDYDKLDRLTSETSGGVKHDHTSYDKAGNRLVTTYGRTGTTLVSTYDALNRLATCDERASSSATSGQVTSYSYEIGGKVAIKSLPDNLVTHTTYDKLGRTLKIRDLKLGSQLSLTDYSIAAGTWPSGYDAVGNVLHFQSRAVGGAIDRDVSNVYDHAYRLTTETVDSVSGTDVVTSYGYSLANNRTSKTVGSATTSYVYGNGANGGNSNQLLSYGPSGQTATHTFAYDANGNRSTKVTSAGSQSLVWDFENRLTSVTLPSGTYAGTHTYVYDHRGRRVVRNESSGGGVETRLTYSGGTSVQESNASNVVQTEIIRGSDWGGGVGSILYSIRGGQRSYNSYDSRGDVVAVTNSSGTRTWQAAYEAFGTRTVETGTNAERQRANTKEEDPTGLLNEGLRYRDLEAGIFISRDPAGFVDGPNDYTYVRQNPWSAYDPDGLFLEWLENAGYRNNEAKLAGVDVGLAYTFSTPKAVSDVVEFDQHFKLAERTGGGAKFIGGALEMGAGYLAAPFSGGASLLALGHGYDVAASGWSDIWTGQTSRTLTHQVVGGYAMMAGAEFETADTIGGLTCAATSMGTSVTTSLAITRSSRVVAAGARAEVEVAEAVAVAEVEEAPVMYGPFHRVFSPTHTGEVNDLMKASGELWGQGARQVGGGRGIPAAKAYVGPLPEGKIGTEFMTPVKPTNDTLSGIAKWSRDTPGVEDIDSDWVKIAIEVTKDTFK